MRKLFILTALLFAWSASAEPCPIHWASKEVTNGRKRLIQYQVISSDPSAVIVGWSTYPLGDWHVLYYRSTACNPVPCQILFRYSKPCGLDLKSASSLPNPNR